jgi:hypothetical protein
MYAKDYAPHHGTTDGGMRGVLPLPATLRAAYDLAEVVALLVLSSCAAP